MVGASTPDAVHNLISRVLQILKGLQKLSQLRDFLAGVSELFNCQTDEKCAKALERQFCSSNWTGCIKLLFFGTRAQDEPNYLLHSELQSREGHDYVSNVRKSAAV